MSLKKPASFVLCSALVFLLTTSAISQSQPQYDTNQTGSEETVFQEASESSDVILPPNIIAPGSLVHLLNVMLKRSPTFRRQCRQISLTRHMRITIEYTT